MELELFKAIRGLTDEELEQLLLKVKPKLGMFYNKVMTGLRDVVTEVILANKVRQGELTEG